MLIIDLEGEHQFMDSPLVVSPNDKTVICNGQITFRNSEQGIVFHPTKPGTPVRVSMLALRDLDIVNPNGPCIEIQGGGKETTIDNVRVTGKGGLHATAWDGGSIQRLYAFDCHDYGVRIDRMHAAEVHVIARQTRGGPGLIVNEMRGCTGSIYSESNGQLGAEFTDCENSELMLHFENNQREISGTIDWRSLGHTFQQVKFTRCDGMTLDGYWGLETGQWIGNPHGTIFDNELVASNVQTLVPPKWDLFWPDPAHRPSVTIHGPDAKVLYPAGCFNHANQNRQKSQRWHLWGVGDELPANTRLRCWVHVDMPANIRDDLMEFHNEAQQNGLGTLGFGGFNYPATFHDKAYVTLHPWNGEKQPAAIASTWTKQATPCYPNYQPCVGIASWNNPAFEASYRFGISVIYN